MMKRCAVLAMRLCKSFVEPYQVEIRKSMK